MQARMCHAERGIPSPAIFAADRPIVNPSPMPGRPQSPGSGPSFGWPSQDSRTDAVRKHGPDPFALDFAVPLQRREDRKVVRSPGFGRFGYGNFRLEAGLRTLDQGLRTSPGMAFQRRSVVDTAARSRGAGCQPAAPRTRLKTCPMSKGNPNADRPWWAFAEACRNP
jgi:hypothetical protein